MKFYSVRDNTAEFFLPPFMAPNDSVAKRMFIGSLGDSFAFRQDFQLYHVGDFDDQNGLIQPINPQLILAGHSIAAQLDPRPGVNVQEARQ